MLPNGMSMDQLREKINRVLNGETSSNEWRFYARELYEATVVYHEYMTGDYYEAPYSVDESGEVTLGEARKVNMIYVAAKSSDVAGAPTEIQVIPFGNHDTSKGPIILDEEGAKSIITAFEEQRNDMVIDYEHQTLYGGEAPAAGWIKKLVNKGKEGVWAVVEWTDRAREYLKNKEYRYLSPVLLRRAKDNHVVRLINAALTNAPAMDGMVPIVNKGIGGDVFNRSGYVNTRTKKEEGKMKELLVLLGLKEDATEAEAVEAFKKIQARAGLGDKAVVVIGLKEDATEADVEAAVTALKEGKPGVPQPIVEALELKEGATVSEAVGTITALKQGSDKTADLVKEVTALKERLATDDAEDAVELAMSEGKITPAQREWAKAYALRDLEGFKAFAAKAPVVVPLSERKPVEVAGGGAVLDEVQMSVNKSLGIDDETFNKHNKKEQGDT